MYVYDICDEFKIVSIFELSFKEQMMLVVVPINSLFPKEYRHWKYDIQVRGSIHHLWVMSPWLH